MLVFQEGLPSPEIMASLIFRSSSVSIQETQLLSFHKQLQSFLPLATLTTFADRWPVHPSIRHAFKNIQLAHPSTDSSGSSFQKCKQHFYIKSSKRFQHIFENWRFDRSCELEKDLFQPFWLDDSGQSFSLLELPGSRNSNSSLSKKIAHRPCLSTAKLVETTVMFRRMILSTVSLKQWKYQKGNRKYLQLSCIKSRKVLYTRVQSSP